MLRCLKLHLDVKVFEACPMRNSSKRFITKGLTRFFLLAACETPKAMPSEGS